MFKTVCSLIKTVVPQSLLPTKNVKGQTVLITGAGSGLGRLMCLRFADLGSDIVLWDVNQEGNEQTANIVREKGVKAYTFTVDLSKREDIYRVAEQVKSDIGDVDILINNAGIVTGKKFLDSSDGLIQKTMEVNTMALFWTVKCFLPKMIERNNGHIVNIASAAGLSGVTGLCDYCASKFAVVGFDESLRNELNSLGKDGVHTTLICPYYINTGMFDGVKSKYPMILNIQKSDDAVNKIMQAILTNQPVLLIPRILNLVIALKNILPAYVYMVIANVMGVNDSMNDFVGREKGE